MKTYLLIFINYIRFNIKKITSQSKVSVSRIQRVGLSTKLTLVKGSRFSLGHNVCISESGSVFVGENGNLDIKEKVYFNRNVFISCQNKITIEANCLFGPDVKIIDNNHKFCKSDGVSITNHSVGEIYIGEKSWIGANVVLLKNAYIGKRCVIGAGCVINEKIPDNSIVTLDSKSILIKPIEER